MIEFGPKGMIEHCFASGDGHGQQERFASAYFSNLLGIRAGTCRSCKVAYVSGPSDIARMCIHCLKAKQAMRAVEVVDTANADNASTVGRSRVAGSSVFPMGFDDLDDLRGAS